MSSSLRRNVLFRNELVLRRYFKFCDERSVMSQYYCYAMSNSLCRNINVLFNDKHCDSSYNKLFFFLSSFNDRKIAKIIQTRKYDTVSVQTIMHSLMLNHNRFVYIFEYRRFRSVSNNHWNSVLWTCFKSF